MRWYYPFLPRVPDRLNAWKKQPQRVDLDTSAGHQVSFPGLRMYPMSFPMRHYLFLSAEHAIRKYVLRRYNTAELSDGWHRARAALAAEDIVLQGQRELRHYEGDHSLDDSAPLTHHPLFSGKPSR
jgi:hypothetical protein